MLVRGTRDGMKKKIREMGQKRKIDICLTFVEDIVVDRHYSSLDSTFSLWTLGDSSTKGEKG